MINSDYFIGWWGSESSFDFVRNEQNFLEDLFMFLLVSMSSIVITQNRYHVDKTTFALKDTVVFLKYDMKPINGVLYCDYGDIGVFVEGKPDGLVRLWHENGQLEDEVTYKNGKKDGLERIWHENGQLGWEVTFKDDELISERCFDENANKISCE